MNLNNNYHSSLSQCREEKDDEEEEDEERRLLRGLRKPASLASSTSSSRTEIVPAEEEQLQPLKKPQSFVLRPQSRYFNGIPRKTTPTLAGGSTATIAASHSLTVPKVSPF